MPRDPKHLEGVEFEEDDNGRVAATHRETGISCYGDSEDEAINELADALDEIPGGGCAELWEFMSEFRQEN